MEINLKRAVGEYGSTYMRNYKKEYGEGDTQNTDKHLYGGAAAFCGLYINSRFTEPLGRSTP